MSPQEMSREFIISRLEAGLSVDESSELTAYPSDSLFVVDFLAPEEPLDTEDLTREQVEQLAEEGELSEFCDTAEEAADLYLKLRAKYGSLLVRLEDFAPPTEEQRATPQVTGS